MAVSGGHVEDGVAVVVGDGVEGVWGEGGDKVLDVGEVAEAGAEEDVFLVLRCRRGWHDARSVISHPHHHRLSCYYYRAILSPCAALPSLIYGAPVSRRQPRLGTLGHHGAPPFLCHSCRVLIVSSWGPFSSSISGPTIASNVSGESRPQLLAAAPDRPRGGIKVHILARSSAS